jgi:hypothetical protein
MAVKILVTIFWVVTPCGVWKDTSVYPEDGGSMDL